MCGSWLRDGPRSRRVEGVGEALRLREDEAEAVGWEGAEAPLVRSKEDEGWSWVDGLCKEEEEGFGRFGAPSV